jgi:tRNA pseudouridine32 synthase / 23S rRNA pseudouridine746 synthase
MRLGVSASRVGVGSQRYDNVLHFLCSRFPHVHDWPERLLRGDVLDACQQALSGHEPCRPGMLIWYWRSPAPEPRVPFELDLLHQDEYLVVVDKPHFLPVTPGGRHLHETALLRLTKQLGISTLAPLHRLDRETAGVLVFTVQPSTRGAYSALLRQHQVHKVYEAVASWRPDLLLPLSCSHRLGSGAGAGFMQTQLEPGPANAHMTLQLIQRLAAPQNHEWVYLTEKLAYYRLTPRTGRKHQLRAQMNALGLPIAGDRIYPQLWPDTASDQTPDYSRPLQLLAREFSFTDPINGQQRRFVSRRQLALAAYL